MVWLIFRRMMSTSFRPRVLLDKQLEEKLSTSEIKARKHPGVFDRNKIRLPQTFLQAADRVISDKSSKDLEKRAKVLNNHLVNKKPPLSDDAREELKVKAVKQVMERNPLDDLDQLDPEEKESLRNSQKQKVINVYNQLAYNWRPTTYNEDTSLLYLVARAAPDYATLSRVFNEIQTRDPNFQPQSLFDFGSGIGMVSWATSSVWKNKVREMFCVDSSVHMNNLALTLLRGGNQHQPEENDAIPGLFFRQFLPSSSAVKFDLVVSAHSLLELPSAELRLQTVLSLWRKTRNYLVLVEHGSKAAYDVLIEARDFIISLSEDEVEPNLHGHVFAPCPHDSNCPLESEVVPCNFEVSYEPLFSGSGDSVAKERFSYVVFKKGQRPGTDPQWPRVVRPVLRPSKQTICRLCTRNGQFQEVIFTRSKYDARTVKCAKNTKWGDLLPVSIVQTETDELDDAPKKDKN